MQEYTGAKLGQAVNLLRGFRPTENPADCTASPFYPLEHVPFRLYDVCLAGSGDWEPIRVSLHDTAQSLAGEIFDYRVLPFANEERGFSVDTGALLTAVESQLGLEIEPGLSYMLIQARRRSGRAVHEVFARPEGKPFNRRVHLTREGLTRIANLRPGDRLRCGVHCDARIAANDAQEYLRYFSHSGTHFVSAVEAGDAIYQVFAYAPATYAVLKQECERRWGRTAVSGLDAAHLSYYTSGRYALKRGRIVSWSRDSVLLSSLASGVWRDPRYMNGDSLFQALHNTSLLSQFRQVAPLAFELMPQSRFFEFYRALSFQRLLKGALLQKYGSAVHVSLPRLQERNWETIFPDDSAYRFPEQAEPDIEIYQDRLEPVALPGCESLTLSTIVFQCRESAEYCIPGKRVALTANVIDGARHSALAPVIALNAEALDSFKLCCQEMEGVLFLTTPDGSRHEVVIDGYRFRTPDNCEDIRTAPSPSANQIFQSELAIEYWTRAPLPNADAALAAAESNLAWLAPDAAKPPPVQAPAYSEWRSLITRLVEPLTRGRFLPPQATASHKAALLAGYRKFLAETDNTSRACVAKNPLAAKPGRSAEVVRLRTEERCVLTVLGTMLAWQAEALGRQLGWTPRPLSQFSIAAAARALVLHDEQFTEPIRAGFQSEVQMNQLFRAVQSFSAASSPATEANLVAQMKQNGPVLNGWDVVFNMLEYPVNKIFQMQFIAAANSSWKDIALQYGQVFPNPGGAGQVAVYTAITMTLMQPSLQIAGNNQNIAKVHFEVAGTLETITGLVDDNFDPAQHPAPDSAGHNWTSRKTPFERTAFEASVPLTLIQGAVAGNHDVVLDFPAGSFNSPVFLQAKDPNRLQLELKTYFANRGVRYVINEVRNNAPQQVSQLTPRVFRLNTVTTNSGKNVLQLYVATDSPEPRILTINVNEPVPDGYGFSLMISQRIVKQLGAGITQGASLFALENLIFPGDRLLQLGPEYSPADLLALGHFQLAPQFTIAAGDRQSVVRQGNQVPGGIARFGSMQVIVTNAMGTRIAGLPVLFSVGTHPPMMAVQLDAGGSSSATVATDQNGIATLSGASCYYDQGPVSILAGAGGGQTEFHLTVAPTPPPPVITGGRLNIIAGDHQTAWRSGNSVPGGIARFGALQVQLQDSTGKPVPNYGVAFNPGSHSGAMAVQVDPSGAAPHIAMTDPGGVATLNAMGGSSVSCYYADGPFTVLASVAGVAPVTFSLNVAATPPPPPLHGASTTIISGDHQSVPRTGLSIPGGIANFAPLQVLVRGADGRPVANVPVSFNKGSGNMAVQMDPSGAAPVTVNTDAGGIATLNRMQGYGVSCYYNQGPFTVTASVPGGAQTVFSLTVAPSPPPPDLRNAHIRISTGDRQRVARSGGDVAGGTARFAPLQVIVSDALDNPIPNARVDFNPGAHPGAMAVQVHPSGAMPASVLTDPNGRATLNLMPGGTGVWAYYASGGFQVTATVANGPQAVFSLTVS